MKVLFKVALAILAFLAVSSGITKVLLIEQEVEFFGQYGFTNPILVFYGAAQLIGGFLLIVQRTRLPGAAILAITFSISAVVLVMAGNVPFTIFTIAALLMLGLVIRQSLDKEKKLSA